MKRDPAIIFIQFRSRDIKSVPNVETKFPDRQRLISVWPRAAAATEGCDGSGN
jgi:hypothetical protein